MSKINYQVPPHSEEAEEACLGALLLNFSVDLLDSIRELVGPSDFYKGAHRLIFSGIIELHDKGGGVDLLTLNDWLKNQGKQESIGGAGYLAALTSRVPTVAHAGHYAQMIKELSLRRALIETSRTTMEKSYDQTREVRQVVEETERAIFDLCIKQSSGEIRTAQEVVQKTVEGIQERTQNKGQFTGIPSGIEGLDSLTDGFQNSEMIIVGARPSIGKTALALSLAANIAIRQKVPCGFFTLEMSGESLMMRILAGEARINSSALKNGMIGRKSNYGRLVDAASLIYDSSLLIQDTPNIAITDLRSLARRMVTRHNVKIIFIDYIGLISSDEFQLPRHEQMSRISRSLKGLARELDIPLIVLSQVGRSSEGKVPSLSELRDTGALEQDADVVIFLHRDREEAMLENRGSSNMQKAELFVAKHRNGPTGKVEMAFLPEYTRFENLTR